MIGSIPSQRPLAWTTIKNSMCEGARRGSKTGLVAATAYYALDVNPFAVLLTPATQALRAIGFPGASKVVDQAAVSAFAMAPRYLPQVSGAPLLWLYDAVFPFHCFEDTHANRYLLPQPSCEALRAEDLATKTETCRAALVAGGIMAACTAGGILLGVVTGAYRAMQ